MARSNDWSPDAQHAAPADEGEAVGVANPSDLPSHHEPTDDQGNIGPPKADGLERMEIR